jgi:uncharacterized Ntn-hydrolase superfamily protein
MTFSISGYCKKTGMVGIAITSSSICVASRCSWVRSGVGAAVTQNITDPSLGNLMIDYLDEGLTSQEAINKIINDRDFIEYRQLAVIDIHGNSASYTGTKILGTNAVVKNNDCIAAGNLLKSNRTIEEMCKKFSSNPDLHLGERLLLSLQAGLDAGGEEGSIHSAGLKVAFEHPWPLIDLRVDWADDKPIFQLMDLWKSYEPQMMDYNSRAVNPSEAPSYGVPGDE